MKIAYLVSYPQSGTLKIAEPVAERLRSTGVEVDLIIVDKGKGEMMKDLSRSLEGYDLAHFWNFATRTHFDQDLTCPSVMTMHHLPFGYEGGYFRLLAACPPNMLHVLDHFTQRQLGQHGFTNVAYIKQTFDHRKWRELPVPDDPALGYLGGNSDGLKRLPVIREAAERLGWPAIGNDSSKKWVDDADIVDIYRRCSIFVVAGFNEAGPLPAQEALLCGRPVITTYVGTMPDVIIDAYNGKFVDGSVASIVDAASSIHKEYHHYQHGVAHTYFPDPGIAFSGYVKMYKRVTDEGRRKVVREPDPAVASRSSDDL